MTFKSNLTKKIKPKIFRKMNKINLMKSLSNKKNMQKKIIKINYNNMFPTKMKFSPFLN